MADLVNKDYKKALLEEILQETRTQTVLLQKLVDIAEEPERKKKRKQELRSMMEAADDTSYTPMTEEIKLVQQVIADSTKPQLAVPPNTCVRALRASKGDIDKAVALLKEGWFQ